MCIQGVDELQQRDHPLHVGGPQRHFSQALASADPEQVADRDQHPRLGEHGVHLGLQPGPQGHNFGPIAHQLPQLARRRWRDPRLGQSVHPQQISQIGGVADVVLHPPVPKSLDSQRVCQMAVPSTLPHLDDVPTIRHLPGVKMIARTARTIKRVLPGVGDRSALQGNDIVAPQTRFQTRVSAHRRVAFGSLSLDDVKMIKNSFGCTVNDVVLAICAAALRSWLEARGELPAQPLAGMIPISIRTPEQMGTFGNRVSVMISELPTNVADPVQRLLRVSQTMKAAKEHHRALPASLMQDANHFIPPALFAQAARATSRLAGVRGIDQPVNVVISNVPGPKSPLYLGGARQRAQFPISAVLDGIGLNITVISYQDCLEFGIVVDREQVDDAWPILDALQAGLDELHALAQQHAAGKLSI